MQTSHTVTKLSRRFLLLAALLAGAAPAWAASTAAFKVEVRGHGPAMILIPGLASSGEVWDDTVAHYSARYECHVLTLAGFAGVPPVEGSMLAAAEKQLADYIAEKKLDRPVIVGHSLGGFLGLKLAADYPALVGKLVIVDSLPALGAIQVPTMTAPQLQVMGTQMRDSILRQDAAAFTASQRRSAASMVGKPEAIDRIVGWGAKSDRATVAGAMGDLIGSDLRDDVARIKAPTLVMGTWIAYKEFAPRSAIEATFAAQYRKLPGATIVLADNAKHFIMVDDPQWMYAQMDQFLK